MDCLSYTNEITEYNYFYFDYKYFYILNIFLYSYMILMLWDRLKINDQFLNTFINSVWYLLRNIFIVYIWIEHSVIRPSIKYLNKYITFDKESQHKYVIIRDGIEIMCFKNDEELCDYVDIASINYVDDDIMCNINDELIYYSKLIDFTKCLNKYKQITANNILFEKSNIAFFSCYVFIELKNTTTLNFYIDLKHFMINHNKILSKSFITWYANNYLSRRTISFNMNDIKLCNVIILDGNIKEHRIAYGDYNDNIMIIKKDGYSLEQITYNPIYEKEYNDVIDDSDIDDDDTNDDDTIDDDTNDDDIVHDNDNNSITTENELDKIIETVDDSMEDIEIENIQTVTNDNHDNKNLDLCDCSDCEEYDKLNNVNSSWWSLFLL